MNIFITGGTSGIGLELAHLYVSLGNRVGVCSRSYQKKTNSLINFYKADVTKIDELKNAFDKFSKDGEIDLLILSAGISISNKSFIPDMEISRKIINTNVLGVMNAIDLVLSNMLERKAGHIACISSVAGFIGIPGNAAYSASKSALIKLFESYSISLSKYGVSFTCICPGFVDTPLTQKNNHPMPFLISSRNAAIKIEKSIRYKKKLVIFPLSMSILIIFLEKIPRFMYRILMKLSYYKGN